jgi:hypothetical protein
MERAFAFIEVLCDLCLIHGYYSVLKSTMQDFNTIVWPETEPYN